MPDPSGQSRDSRVAHWLTLACVALGCAVLGGSLFMLRKVRRSPLPPEHADAVADALQDIRGKKGSYAGTREPVPIGNAELFCARLDEFLHMARSRVGFSGAVLVARHGAPVYQGALGFSHLESKARNSLDTPFRIASLSKQFTAAAILHLEAQGKLSVHDPVHLHLEEFGAEPYRQITIHHLLTHSSGLPRIADEGDIWQALSEARTPVEAYVKLACRQPLRFKPGTAFHYSNFGYRVLSALITSVSGLEYADFMEQSIFEPLGLDSAGVARISRPGAEEAVAEELVYLGSDQQTGEPRYARANQDRNFGTGYGSGGVYISANDLLRWDRALAGNELLPREQIETLFAPNHDQYACGWIVKTSGLDNRLCQMHNGANDGSFSQMMRIPSDDLVIIAVGNVKVQQGMNDTLVELFRLCRSLPYQDPPQSSRGVLNTKE